jgi:hypothetical protein
MNTNYSLPSIKNPKVVQLWVVKHFKMEDPNSGTSLSSFQILKDDQLTIPLHMTPDLPVGHEPGETGPNPRIPTPEKEPWCNITQDALYPADRGVDPALMRKKLDHITVFCDSIVETGRTMTNGDGKVLRELSVTFNQPWHGIGNGGNRLAALAVARDIARKENLSGNTALLETLSSQYVDIVFSRGYTESQALEVSHILNETNKVEAWAQLVHSKKVDWFIDALDGKAHGYQEDKHLTQLNPNLSKRIRFISGADSALNVEEALQVLQMFNRESYPHKKSKVSKVHAARSSITNRLSKEDDKLNSELKKLAPVAAYLLMIHDYIRLNAINWCAPQTQLGFLEAKETNAKNIVCLQEEKEEALLEKKKILIRSLAHPLCFALSQYLNKNSKGDWEWLSTPFSDGNGFTHIRKLSYEEIIKFIDDIGESYMDLVAEKFSNLGTKKEVNTLMRDESLWEETYQLVRDYIEKQALWKPAALLVDPPSKLLSTKKYGKSKTSKPKPAAKVSTKLTTNN